jgi:uncharacterized protein with PQ loop repeat/RNA polymerase subunit RPABC4/transcription elongation factor Spt4
MDAILGQVADALDQLFGQPTVQHVVAVAFGYVVILWIATALWAFVDMRRRTFNVFAPYASAAAVIVASPLLFPLALLVHVVVRPAGTVADRRMGGLRDAALSFETERQTCPGCDRPVGSDWLLCPNCRTTLAHLCETCGHAVAADWDACAWCGASFAAPVGLVRAD